MFNEVTIKFPIRDWLNNPIRADDKNNILPSQIDDIRRRIALTQFFGDWIALYCGNEGEVKEAYKDISDNTRVTDEDVFADDSTCGLSRPQSFANVPDVLVTNVAMLNAMLMRDQENNIFSQTQSWLESDDSNVLTFIVDELHLNRGTAGSEIGMVVRNFIQRIGLSPQSPQIRFLATSASMSDIELGKSFAADFFGAKPESFLVTAGAPRPVPEMDALDPEKVLSSSYSDTELSWSLVNACKSPEGSFVGTSAETIKDRLFGVHHLKEEAFKLLLERLGASTDSAVVKTRGHIFFRTPRGLWACTSPMCSGVTAHSYKGRMIGKLFDTPVVSCDACFSRVLELLYCFDCGDVSLGGFLVEPQKDEESVFLGSLSANVPDSGSKDPVFKRSKKNYRWFWPRESSDVPAWSKSAPNPQGGAKISVDFSFVEVSSAAPLSGFFLVKFKRHF
jgi:DEAD/DEAH box helicase domain-containing protein